MASKIIFLKKFNNYYNRIIKKYDTVQNYINASDDYALRGTASSSSPVAGGYGPVNFNINDGITAEMTYNYVDSQDWQPDYILVCDDFASLETAEIQYRFFVMEAVRTRRGQYRLTLRRDLVADNYNNVLNAPMFIEKATLQKDDPFIFNSENSSFNQIKDEDEILLKDNTETPWIVGYIAKPQTTGNDAWDFTGEGTIAHKPDYTVSVANINSWLQPGLLYESYEWSVTAKAEYDNLYNNIHEYRLTTDGISVNNTAYGRYPDTYYWRENGSESSCRSAFKNAAPTTLASDAKAVVASKVTFNLYTSSQISNLLNYNQKIVKNTYGGTDKYYIISVYPGTYNAGYFSYDITSSEASLYSDLETMCTAAFRRGHGNNKGYGLRNTSSVTYYYVNIDEVSNSNLLASFKLPKSRYSLNDAPYCMFCIPYNNTKYVDKDDNRDEISSKELNLAAAFGIAEALSGSGAIYDLQLLPYCPKPEMWDNTNKKIKVDGFEEGLDYTYYTNHDGTDNIGIILWCTESTGTLSISVNLPAPNTAIDTKVENETSMYRLVSPNYSGMFEFNVAKNNGVDFINIDYAYKPYTPYIHANINFKNLYGTDTNDTRGLVCGGDYSLPQTSDQWKTYEINNKNFQQQFDRQITNMDVMHGYDRTEGIVKAVTGTVTGAAAGAVGGSMIPGVGTAAGLITGTAASLAAGATDIYLSEQRYKEQVSYATDQFNYNLQNIKARPDTLSKVSSFNPNNKIFLFIEHYHATTTEQDALREKIKYNGMTVGRIGTINEFLQTDYSFIKGKLIRLEDIADDFHNSAELASELEKGVFIK